MELSKLRKTWKTKSKNTTYNSGSYYMRGFGNLLTKYYLHKINNGVLTSKAEETRTLQNRGPLYVRRFFQNW